MASTYPYRPMPPPPPGGLLNSVVGPATRPMPPLTLNRFEDDNVANEVSRVTDQGGPLMQRAAASGLATANRRGLLNSTMAVEASQNAVLDKAIPIASQTAAQRAARDAQRLDYQAQSGLQGNQIASQERMQGLDLSSRERIATAGNVSAEKIAQEQIASEEAKLGRQLTFQEQAQIRDIAAQQAAAAAQFGYNTQLQGAQLASQERLANAQIAAESERLGRQLTAQEQAQIRDITSQQYMQQQDIGSRSLLQQAQLTSQETLTREGYANDLQKMAMDISGANTRANLSAATTIQQTYLTNLNDSQKATLAYYLDMNRTYSTSLDNLYGNKDLPAPARDDAIQTFLALRNAGVDLPKAVYGTTLNWGGSTAPPPATLPPPPPQIDASGNIVTPPPPAAPSPPPPPQPSYTAPVVEQLPAPVDTGLLAQPATLPAAPAPVQPGTIPFDYLANELNQYTNPRLALARQAGLA